jgi:hypothetical protein
MCLSVRTLFAVGSSKHKKSLFVITDNTFSNGVRLMYMSVGMLDHVYVFLKTEQPNLKLKTCGCMYTVHFCCYEAKLPNLKLKTWSRQLHWRL